MAPLFQQPFMSGGFPSMNRAATPDFESDYSTAGDWTVTGTKVTVDSGTADKVNWNYGSAGGDHRVSQGMGITVSDTTWTADLDFIINSNSGGENWILILGDQDANFITTSMDGLAFGIYSTFPDKLRMWYRDGGTVNVDTVDMGFTDATQYYGRLQRTSATNLRNSVFDNSGRTSHISDSPDNFTVPSTVQGLDTVIHSGRSDHVTGSYDVDADNIAVYDGVTL